MKAVVYERYGPPEVLQLREVDTPVPGHGDVLIKVMAASVNRSDWETLTGKPLYARIGGLLRPRHQILGSDIAGRVEAVGKSVESFRPGDEVFGDVMYHGASGFAEYVRVPQSAPLAHKPAGISYAQASTLPQAGVIALQGIEGHIKAGSGVLINGAGGGAGGFAVQMAKAAGAEVTAVDNPHKQDFLRSLGADSVIDYTQTDYTKTARPYDLILDLVCERSIFAIRRAVAPGGRYLVVGGSVRALLSAAIVGKLLASGGRRLGVLMVRPNQNDLVRLAEMVVAGELRPTIDRIYPLEEVPAALRRLGEGKVLGKVVIELG
ncbi:MAG TPA: NAD(P)-dependent alcohol dehydrogenase [Acidimicrobiia bacterium]|nr:NAD(P)-dependent alcohol dehydrogenase [Acidimicrobiia bacterium]